MKAGLICRRAGLAARRKRPFGTADIFECWQHRERSAAGPRPQNMWDILFYLLIIVVLGGAAAAAAYFGRNYLQGGGTSVFGNRAERRLDVVEQSSIDGRRRLVLIRRDNVEHLIMTGGPVDVVIETNISQRRGARAADVVEAPQAVFSRPQRAFGSSAANE